MKSYFFIPGNKLRKILSISEQGMDHIIVDFEDSILLDQREAVFSELQSIPDYGKMFYRVPVRDSFNEVINFDFLARFIQMGITKFVIPKLKSAAEFSSLKSFLPTQGFEVILLVEHPRLFIDVERILREDEPAAVVSGLGLGSHDMSVQVGFDYVLHNLEYLRVALLLQAKAFGITAIDIASMNIDSKQLFDEEVNSGLSMGYDSKFLIHPKQWRWINENTFIRDRDLLRARRIVDALPPGVVGSEIEPFILDGQVIEKPHIEKALKIIAAYGK